MRAVMLSFSIVVGLSKLTGTSQVGFFIWHFDVTHRFKKNFINDHHPQ
jgi:hypothetical protein